MFRQLKAARAEYPRQFWLMFYGMLLSTLGSSMIWPFLMIYVSERLRLPLAVVASLMTISAAMGLIASFLAGPIVDRAGRKWVLVISLFANALSYLLMSQARALPAFALLMGLNGAFNPLYRVGSDAMLADLIPNEKRVDAYSLLRMSNNLGIAIGPAIGGLLASTSYHLAFYGAASGLAAYGLLIACFARETLPDRQPAAAGGAAASSGRAAAPARAQQAERLGGYGEVFADRPYMAFVVTFTLTQICAALIWVLMSVYAKRNYGIPESQYGFIAATNALMVVLFQVLVTQWTKRYAPLPVIALGSLIYAVAVSAVALAHTFWGFWLVMVALTMGELILAPTSSTYAANRAPADKRGRYMSLYSLSWGVASGIGPVLGGLLNDNIGPRAIWIGGGLIGLTSVAGFLVLAQRARSAAAAGRAQAASYTE